MQLFQCYFKCMAVEYRKKWLLFSSSLLSCWTPSVMMWDSVAKGVWGGWGRGEENLANTYIASFLCMCCLKRQSVGK